MEHAVGKVAQDFLDRARSECAGEQAAREPGEVVQRDGELTADLGRSRVGQPGQGLVDPLKPASRPGPQPGLEDSPFAVPDGQQTSPGIPDGGGLLSYLGAEAGVVQR